MGWKLRVMLCMMVITLALPYGNFIRKTIFFGPITHNLHDFSDIGTFAFCLTGAKYILMLTMPGTLLGSGLTFWKHRTVIKIFEKTGGNANGWLTGQMVEEEKTQPKVTEINLIAHKIDVVVSQKFIPGKPGYLAAGTRFKYFHGFTYWDYKYKDVKSCDY